MVLILSRFMTEAHVERLITAFHVVLSGCVFVFLAIVLLS